MLRFLEDADLVEQERDDIHRILFAERKSTCEFPFAVDTTVGRTEDDAACSSYGHRSSSESLRGETELCSSTDNNRRSPIISSASASSTVPNYTNRQISNTTTVGSSHYNNYRGQQQEQLNRSSAPIYAAATPYYEMGSPKKNDCPQQQQQVNGNFSSAAMMANYQAYSMMPPGATAGCFSPPYGTGQPGHLYQTLGYHQPFYSAYPATVFPYTLAGGQFLLPQIVARQPTAAQLGQSPQLGLMRLASSTAASTTPNYFSPTGMAMYQHPPPAARAYASALSTEHYSMENLGAAAAASYTGQAIIQEDVSSAVLSSSSSSRINAQQPHHHYHHERTNSNDEYQQQQQTTTAIVDSTNLVDESMVVTRRDSTTSPHQIENMNEDEDVDDEDEENNQRTSCDSPTIVIEADQNAAALASRQRASALLNSSSTINHQQSMMNEETSSIQSPIEIMNEEEISTVQGQQQQPKLTEANSNNNIYHSSTQSPLNSDENIETSNRDVVNVEKTLHSPVSEIVAKDGDVYYDAEADLQQNRSPSPIEMEEIVQEKLPSVDSMTTTTNENDETNLASSSSAAAATTQKSWASLFKNTHAANQAIVVKKSDSDEEIYQRRTTTGEEEKKKLLPEEVRAIMAGISHDPNDVVTVDLDQGAMRLAEQFQKVEFMNRGPTFVLRGIVNRGNWCYVNASLQALMACPPFYHFLRNLAPYIRRRHTSTPLLDAFVKFANEFPLMDRSGRLSGNTRAMNQPLDPIYLHSIITRLRSDASFKGRQEDAEEFLLQVFNVLHDEMVSCLSLLDKDRSDPSSRERSVNGEVEEMDSSEWQQVGPGRKAAVTRQTKYTQSPLSQLFLGQLRYGLSQPGAKESANLEPFYTLPLEVTGVTNISSALQSFTSKETLKNFTGKNKTEVDATRRVTFHELPRVMIFQLKYFVYTDEGLKKIVKPMEYPMDLNIDPNLLFNRGKTVTSRQYKLFAVVFHHGEKAEGGHYTVDIFHGGSWNNVDDTKTSIVNNDHVLNYRPPRVPYLLFYRRWDQTPPESQQQQQQQQR